MRVVLVMGLVLVVSVLPAQEEAAPGAGRNIAMRIIVDTSSSLSRGKAGAVNWLCDTIIDRTLQGGDLLYLVAAGESDEVIFDGIIGDAAQKEMIKKEIRMLKDPEGASYAARTLERVFSAGLPEPERISVTIIVCGTDITDLAAAEHLRYARTEHFAYWRAITVAPGLEEEVNRALKKALP
jgi:hypothetical protein